MPGFKESSITLEFPDASFFRFCDCLGYRRLSGNNFKEVDACWYDNVNNTYWLIELKDFSLANLTTAESIEQRAWPIWKKAVDSISMILCSKHNYPYSVNLNGCLPHVPDNSTVFRVMTIIHCDYSQRNHVQLLHNSFRNKFKPYADLFGIQHYGVIEHNQAILQLPHMIQ